MKSFITSFIAIVIFFSVAKTQHVFRASNSPLAFEAEQWKSDGTEAGTVSFELYQLLPNF